MAEQSFQHYLLGLIAVANNIPAIPLYLELCKGRSEQEQHRLCFVATFTAFITMVLAMFSGMAVLNFFEISIDAFRMAGGLLLLNTGLGMMKSNQQSATVETEKPFEKILATAIIPIAIPLTTGAGTMSTVILFTENMSTSDSLKIKLMSAILCMTVLIYLSFRYSPAIIRVLKDTGMDVLTKVFGLITLSLGIQFIISGMRGAFPVLMQ